MLFIYKAVTALLLICRAFAHLPAPSPGCLITACFNVRVLYAECVTVIAL